MSELKECPFCGGAAEMWKSNESFPKRKAWIACMGGCGVMTNEFDSNEKAAEVWNTRAPASTWISFEEQPPEKEGCYLTYWSDGALETYYIVEDDLIEWDIRKQYIKIHNAVLTHWQPLPPPPQ